ncbi:MAG: internal scaffolding protein [Microvirus sp.]|nr:MAG: internal scaffolding protein [Microvirus sp.]
MTKQTLYGFYRPHDPLDTAFTNTDPATGEVYASMTKQSFVEECDMKNILADYNSTGQIRHLNPQAAEYQYADLPPAQDFQEALNTVIQGEAAFAALPSSIRNRFGNSPQQFLEFINDPSNQDEAIRMGLATDNRPPPEAPSPAPGEEKTPPQG